VYASEALYMGVRSAAPFHILGKFRKT